MGGGDLNLKKSWHPSTMRNMEKVWKAEQKHDQEKKRIAELQREIQQEKAREDIKKYAEETGVLEKKDECKLEWMYKGPNNQVNREEYLLGRSIDKTFEQVQEAEKSSLRAGIGEHDKSSSASSNLITPGTHQVDLARKLQEDPLFDIKKKEIECRSQILNNPVKLKKLKQFLESKSEKKSKREKKSKKKKHKKRDTSDSDDDDLDAMLLAKYKKLKKKLSKSDIETLKKECDTSESEDEVNLKFKENKRSKDQGKVDSKRQRSDVNSQTWKRPSEYSQRKPNTENSFRYRRDAVEKQDSKPGKVKMSEEEMERRRAEMLDNAKWREKEREKNIARHKEEEAREKNQNKNYDKDFLRKQLSYAASQGTVESRIRSNINNIQRSSMAMDKNFARR